VHCNDKLIDEYINQSIYLAKQTEQQQSVKTTVMDYQKSKYSSKLVAQSTKINKCNYRAE